MSDVIKRHLKRKDERREVEKETPQKRLMIDLFL